jgi:nitrite reductase/ring-hydroxylating ferredoxin subunit
LATDGPAEHATVRVPVADLPPETTRWFAFERDGEPLTGVVLRPRSGGFAVYVNRCPHVPLYGLDFASENIVDPRDGHLVCANHGARFDASDGRCVFGPARGQALEPLPFREDGDALVVSITPEPPGWPD